MSSTIVDEKCMFNLAALPEDLVTKALTFLSVQSLCLIRAVNPCYRQLANVTLGRLKRFEVLWQFLNNKVFPEEFREMSRHCRQLETIDIVVPENDLISFDFAVEIIKRSPHLRELEVHIHVTDSNFEPMNLDPVIDAACGCPDLEYLLGEGNLCSVSGDSWRALARACPRIEGLMFWGMGLGQFYQWDALRFLLEKLKLKEFSCDFGAVYRKCIARIKRPLEHLKDLNIAFGLQDWEKMTHVFPNLITCDFRQEIYSDLNSQSIKDLGLLPAKCFPKQLYFGHFTAAVTDDFMANFPIHKLRSTDVLDFTGTGITEITIKRVAQAKLPCLELISVESPSLPACALSILLDTAAFPALNEIRYYTFDDMDAELETLVDLFKKRNARLDIEHGQALSLDIEEVILQKKSRFQNISVLKSKTWGKVLVLDGVIQLTERDEFSYHESMAHLPLFSHPNPERVLIVGGGDGGVLREVLRHKCVGEVTVCDIDEAVVDICREYFPAIASGWGDSRVNLVCEDASAYVREKNDFFDVIIADTSDPVGPAASLFEEPFYKSIHHSLRANGIFCAQAECIWLHLDLIVELLTKCAAPFSCAEYASIQIPTYPCGQIGALICKKSDIKSTVSEPIRSCDFLEKLRYYSPEMHRMAFILPPFVKRKVNLARNRP